MKDEINKLKDMFLENLSTVKDLTMLNDLRTKYLGKKSKVVEFSSMMKDLTIEEKKEVGKLINDFKVEVENKLCSLKSELDRKELEDKLNSEKIDVQDSASFQEKFDKMGIADADLWKLMRGHNLWNMIVKPVEEKLLNCKIHEIIQENLKEGNPID